MAFEHAWLVTKLGKERNYAVFSIMIPNIYATITMSTLFVPVLIATSRIPPASGESVYLGDWDCMEWISYAASVLVCHSSFYLLSLSFTRLTRNQVRPVTNDDIGLKVLREAPAEAAQAIECVRPCRT
jgi:hypothetical protein